MTRKKRGNCLVMAVLLFLIACLPITAPLPVAAISLNPFDYFEGDYCITFSENEVQEDKVFYLEINGQVECIQDLPFGANQADIAVSITAQHKETGDVVVLNSAYSVTIQPVPDWEGDTFAMELSIPLILPAGSQPGEYEVVAHLEQAEVDGWDITNLIPESYHSYSIGTVTCAEIPVPPPPPVEIPGHITLDILGNSYEYEIWDDGSIAESVNLNLVEGEVGIYISSGTLCLDRHDEALSYISVNGETSPPDYESGSIITAYKFAPGGATFDPSLELTLSYDAVNLPDETAEEALHIACYDYSARQWTALKSEVDERANTVEAKVSHFSTFAIIADSAPPAPASFVISDLSIDPVHVEPGQSVTISVRVSNDGGTEGSYTLKLLINDKQQNSWEIILGPGGSKTISCQVGKTREGEYSVIMGGLSGKFSVGSVSSAEVPAAGPTQEPEQDSATSPTPNTSLLSWLLEHWLLVVVVLYFAVFVL
ncbi:MAG: hypothetical protein J7L19_03010 [Dehalococcoidia bacterium]|nr:hypothetical protein [Dehalococcoidia bacterium]